MTKPSSSPAPDPEPRDESLVRRIAAHRRGESGGGPESDFVDIPTERLWQAVRGADADGAEPETVLAKPLAGSVLAGRYQMVSCIGKGGAGQVWRAFDRGTKTDVAIKILNAAVGSVLDLDRLLAREGRLLRKLSHPGIVRILDAGKAEELRYLVMDLVEGVALDAVLSELATRRRNGRPVTGADLLELAGPSPSGAPPVVSIHDPWFVAATRMFVAFLRALEAAHGVGVVHRDLKPANLRITAGGVPVLLDFGMGIVAGTRPGTLTGRMFGTPAYSSPEQWSGAGLVGVHTDVYQAGVVLYELLTLQRCFPEGRTADLMQSVCAGRFATPRSLDPQIPGELEVVILRAMALDPARRFPWVADLREPLEAWLGADPADRAVSRP